MPGMEVDVIRSTYNGVIMTISPAESAGPSSPCSSKYNKISIRVSQFDITTEVN